MNNIHCQNYPLKENKIPTNKWNEFDFLQFIKDDIAYFIGCEFEKWNDTFECANIYCLYRNIKKFVFMWDDLAFIYDTKLTINYDNIIETNSKIYNSINVDIRTTIKQTLPKYKIIIPLIKIVSITSDNPSCVDLINKNNLIVYFEVPNDINICKATLISRYIGNALSYSSAHAFKGVIFKLGKKTGNINIMTQNIVEGINSNIALFSKFILTVEFGQNFILKTLQEFISYIDYLKQFVKNLSLCINLNDLSRNGYEPFFILKLINIKHTVDLVIVGNDIMPYFKHRIFKYCELREINLFENDI
jgi:hypothetical protein